jgi:hypothetical protein
MTALMIEPSRSSPESPCTKDRSIFRTACGYADN